MKFKTPESFKDQKEFESWWCNVWLPYIEKLETDEFVSTVWPELDARATV